MVLCSITEDKTGNLWFGTYGGGVSRYDGKSFTTFTTAQGLANNIVWSITEDKTGNLWFGTDGGGVSRYDGKSFSTFTTAQGLANNFVRSITEDKTGNLWFGTSEGLSVLRAEEVRMLSRKSCPERSRRRGQREENRTSFSGLKNVACVPSPNSTAINSGRLAERNPTARHQHQTQLGHLGDPHQAGLVVWSANWPATAENNVGRDEQPARYATSAGPPVAEAEHHHHHQRVLEQVVVQRPQPCVTNSGRKRRIRSNETGRSAMG